MLTGILRALGAHIQCTRVCAQRVLPRRVGTHSPGLIRERGEEHADRQIQSTHNEAGNNEMQGDRDATNYCNEEASHSVHTM